MPSDELLDGDMALSVDLLDEICIESEVASSDVELGVDIGLEDP